MAKGDSGRIVIEIDPEIKKQLYSLLALDQKTLKGWFLDKVEEFIDEKQYSLIKAIRKRRER